MPRRNVPLSEFWNLEVDVPWTAAIHAGDMMVLNAQGDFDDAGGVLNPHDLERQTEKTIAHIHAVLDRAGADAGDITSLRIEYVNDGSVDEAAYRQQVAGAFAGAKDATITFLPFPRLVYPDLVVEIDTFAMRTQAGDRIARTASNPGGLAPQGGPFGQGLRMGEMIYVSGQMALDEAGNVLHPGDIARQTQVVLDNVGRILGTFGANHDDVVRFNIWYVGEATREDWEIGARVRASYFKEPGPVATAIPLPYLQPEGAVVLMEVWAMLGEDGARLPREHAWPEGHWDWPIHLPYKHGLKCRDKIFIGGQVPLDTAGNVLRPGETTVQTSMAMDNIAAVLREFGLGLQDVAKLITYYQLGTVEEFLENLNTRAGLFEKPGPAVVGLPLDTLSVPGLMVEIEAIALES